MFLEHARQSRKLGYAVSHGEVDPGVTGISVALSGKEGHVIGALTLVFASAREGLFNTELLASLLREGANAISTKLATPPEETRAHR